MDVEDSNESALAAMQVHALCAMLASGSCEAPRAWRAMRGQVVQAFGSRADALAGAMRAGNRPAALGAAEALIAGAGETA